MLGELGMKRLWLLFSQTVTVLVATLPSESATR
jgi:hypothetical protein